MSKSQSAKLASPAITSNLFWSIFASCVFILGICLMALIYEVICYFSMTKSNNLSQKFLFEKQRDNVSSFSASISQRVVTKHTKYNTNVTCVNTPKSMKEDLCRLEKGNKFDTGANAGADADDDPDTIVNGYAEVTCNELTTPKMKSSPRSEQIFTLQQPLKSGSSSKKSPPRHFTFDGF